MKRAGEDTQFLRRCDYLSDAEFRDRAAPQSDVRGACGGGSMTRRFPSSITACIAALLATPTANATDVKVQGPLDAEALVKRFVLVIADAGVHHS